MWEVVHFLYWFVKNDAGACRIICSKYFIGRHEGMKPTGFEQSKPQFGKDVYVLLLEQRIQLRDCNALIGRFFKELCIQMEVSNTTSNYTGKYQGRGCQWKNRCFSASWHTSSSVVISLHDCRQRILGGGGLPIFFDIFGHSMAARMTSEMMVSTWLAIAVYALFCIPSIFAAMRFRRFFIVLFTKVKNSGRIPSLICSRWIPSRAFPHCICIWREFMVSKGAFISIHNEILQSSTDMGLRSTPYMQFWITSCMACRLSSGSVSCVPERICARRWAMCRAAAIKNSPEPQEGSQIRNARSARSFSFVLLWILSWRVVGWCLVDIDQRVWSIVGSCRFSFVSFFAW